MKVRFSDDKKRVEEVLQGLKAKDGYCPCKVGKRPENKCICQEFKEQIANPEFEGCCHCGLYFKEK